MTPVEAKGIADFLHRKWVMDKDDDGTYTIDLNPEETEEFFKDVINAIVRAG